MTGGTVEDNGIFSTAVGQAPPAALTVNNNVLLNTYAHRHHCVGLFQVISWI